MPKPNILIFMPDEMRGEVLTNPSVSMPHMKGLMDDGGIIFTHNFSVNPVCGPSRVCTFTGQYPHNGGHRSLYQLLRPGDENLFHILKEDGYEVMWIGRNDLFHKAAIKESVEKRKGNMMGDIVKPLLKKGLKKYGLIRMFRAFRKFRKLGGFKGFIKIPELSDLAEEIMGKRPFDRESKWYNSFYFGKIPDEKAGKSGDDKLIQLSIEYLEKYAASKRKQKKPFCLFVPIAYPHPPYTVEEPYFSMYDREKIEVPYPFEFPSQDAAQKKPAYVSILHEKYGLKDFTEEDFREVLAVYYGMCTKVDALFGQLIQKMKELHLYDNTMVSVFADHGDYAGSYGLTEKWPTGMEDCLLNVPLIVKIPNLKARKTSSDTLTETIDIFPTILETAGIVHPYTHFGKSLLPFIRGDIQVHREAVHAEGGYDPREPQAFEDLCESPHDPGIGIYYYKSITQITQPETVCRTTMYRTRKWKLTLRTSPQAVEELYNLENDPSELQNLIHDPSHQNIVLELKEKMLRWYLETSDNPHYYHKREP